MGMEATSDAYSLSDFEQLRLGRAVIRTEGEALLGLAERLPTEFCEALDHLYKCTQSVIVTGVGKAGLVGHKIAATLASTGSPSHFLHPAEAIHGDLGRVQAGDIVLVLSFSGETEEIVRLLPSFQRRAIPLIALTGNAASSLGKAADVTIALGPLEEACGLGLAPSTSTTVMLAAGDALALVLSRMRGFRREDFAQFHPGGNLGRKLAHVEQVLRPLTACRVAPENDSVRHVLIHASKPGRRTGAVMLTDRRGRLTGLFTDSDLARLLENDREAAIDQPISAVMTARPKTVTAGTRLTDAVALMAEAKISELPVVDAERRPIGMLDVTDVVGLLPADPPSPPVSILQFDKKLPASDWDVSSDPKSAS